MTKKIKDYADAADAETLASLKRLRNKGIKKKKYVVLAKRDKRTKAQLLLLLDATQGHVEMMIQKQINPPVVIAQDSEHYNTGYKDGVKYQQEYDRVKRNWWKFWA